MSDFSIRDIQTLGYSHVRDLPVHSDPYAIQSISNHMTNNVYGINHRQMPLPIPINKDRYGYTFFTRPQLNLQSANLRHHRLFMPLLTDIEKSWQRFVRHTLDPRLAIGYGGEAPLSCPLVDPEMPFIPILSNNLLSISGWKDLVAPTHTSRAGQYKEEHSMVDGISIDYSAYDLTATFRNSRGDPITNLFYYWVHYSSMVFEGTLLPYPDLLLCNEIDYCTRIYRLVMDPSMRKVQRIAACGAAFPTAVSIAGLFDFSSEKPYNDVNAEISIPFRAMGFICMDDILIRSFNEVVGIFNRDMAPPVSGHPTGKDYYAKPGSGMVKVPHDLLFIFNHRGYPRVDPETYELEWYVKATDFYTRMGAYQDLDELLTQSLSFSGVEETI